MNPRLKSALKVLMSGLLTFGCLYLAFSNTDLKKLWEILSHANYWWALAGFPVLILSHMLRAWRWEYMLKPIKNNLRYRNLFSALIVGYMMNNILIRVGELVRPYHIGKLENISRTAAFGTVLIERIFDVLSFMVVIIMIPLVYSGPLLQSFPWLEEAGIWISVLTFGALTLFVFLMLRRDVAMRMLNYFTKHLSERRAKLVERLAHSFLDGFLFLKEPRHYFMIAVLSVFIWGLYIFGMYVSFFAFDMTKKYPLDLGAAMVVQGISSIAQLVPTPGATGSYHLLTIQPLTQLYGVDADIARSYAAVTHAVGYIGVTLVGLYYFLKDGLKLSDVMKRDRPVDTPGVTQ